MGIDEHTRRELSSVRTIDFTTTGRRSGRRSRIEIWWFHIDGRFIITGTPGPRDWYANIMSDPSVIVHSNGIDYPATAVPVHDAATRAAVFDHPDTSWYTTQAERQRLIERAPMIEVLFDDRTG